MSNKGDALELKFLYRELQNSSIASEVRNIEIFIETVTSQNIEKG